MSTDCRIDAGKGRTGAGFRIVIAPRARPRAIAASAAATGISSCVSTTAGASKAASLREISAAVKSSFAPGSIVMQLWPLAAWLESASEMESAGSGNVKLMGCGQRVNRLSEFGEVNAPHTRLGKLNLQALSAAIK